MLKPEDEDCAFFTAQYEGRTSDVAAILAGIDTRIAGYKALLEGMTEAATQPLPGPSLRRTPQEKAIEQIASLTALRERIVRESATDN